MSSKIVFFDIDNTIWRADQVIPESAKRSIRALRDKGNHAFLNSGRARGFINDRELLGLGFDGIVGGCGCYVEIGGKVLRNDLIPHEVVVGTIKVLKKHRLPLILEGWHHLYVDPEDFADDRYYLSLRQRLGDELQPVTGYTGIWEINKISINQEEGRVKNCIGDLSWYYDFIFHGNRFIELVPKGHSKATGMDDVCAYYGIPIEDTFAFGDSTNDLAMLEHAGCGIVMGDGSDDAKAAADYITDPLEDDGIEKALQHFGLI